MSMVAATDVANERDDPVKAWIRSNVPHVVRELFAGGAAGAVAKTFVAPLERTKILLMTGRSRTSALGTLHLIITTEGLPGLFRGNGASCLRIVPYAAIHFSVYEAYRRLLTEYFTPPTPPSAAVADAAASGHGVDGAPPAALQHSKHQHPLHHQHLGEDVPPTPLSNSIEVSATAVITTVEEEQREEAQEEVEAAQQQAEAVAAAAVRVQHDDDGALGRQRQRRPGPLLDLLAGSAAGATAVLTTYPLDMVRTRLAWGMDGAAARKAPGQPQPLASTMTLSGADTKGMATSAAAVTPPPAHHTRIVPMFIHTARHEGIVGLYRGLAPTLYGIMPYAGLKFFVYGSLKQWYRDVCHPPAATKAAGGGTAIGSGSGGGGERLPVPYMLAFGGISGLLAQTVTYPLDVIRRRMQVYGIQQEAAAAAASAATGTAAADAAGGGCAAAAVAAIAQGERLSTYAVGRSIIRQDGFRGLFRGLSLNYVKVVPSTAIGFTVYDMFKSYLGVMGNI